MMNIRILWLQIFLLLYQLILSNRYSFAQASDASLIELSSSQHPKYTLYRDFSKSRELGAADGKLGLFLGYRPSGLHKGNIRFMYPYSVYSSKLGGILFSDSLVFEETIQRDINWGIGLGGTLEIGKAENFWLHIRGEGQIARNFSGANLDIGLGYELPEFNRAYIQPIFLYSLGWSWFQLGELRRGTGSGNREWYIPINRKDFYSDVRVNLRTFYMALRPAISVGYLISSSFMIRAVMGYILPFHHSSALRFYGKLQDETFEAVVSDPKATGSGFIYNGTPTDRTIHTFQGPLFNLEFLYTFIDK